MVLDPVEETESLLARNTGMGSNDRSFDRPIYTLTPLEIQQVSDAMFRIPSWNNLLDEMISGHVPPLSIVPS
jgi:hypothetical protein